MISNLTFEFYCKPAAAIKAELAELFYDLDDYEISFSSSGMVRKLNNIIKRQYHEYNFLTNSRRNQFKETEKRMSKFTKPHKIPSHFTNIITFLYKQLETSGLQLTSQEFLKICFAIALRSTTISPQSNYYSIDGNTYDLDAFMKENSIIDTHFPSTDTNLFVTRGDLCFIFSDKLHEFYRISGTDKFKPYMTSTHTGDIRLIYKTLYYKLAFEQFVTIKNYEFEYFHQYVTGPEIAEEIELLREFGLLNMLYDYSQKMHDKLSLDDEFELLDTDKTQINRNLPILGIFSMIPKCDLRQLIAVLLITYKQHKDNRISDLVFEQACTLLYPAVKDIQSHFLFKQYFLEIVEMLKLDIQQDDLINTMDINQYCEIGSIALRQPGREEINKFMLQDKLERKDTSGEVYFAEGLPYVSLSDFLQQPMVIKHKVDLVEKFPDMFNFSVQELLIAHDRMVENNEN